jgi:hypothetical protein
MLEHQGIRHYVFRASMYQLEIGCHHVPTDRTRSKIGRFEEVLSCAARSKHFEQQCHRILVF